MTNVNFDPERFPSMVRQALIYRNNLKNAYEHQCKERGIKAREFLQTEATWTVPDDVFDGPTERLEQQGFYRTLINL